MSPSSLVGQRVDRYDVDEQLGQGGFGAVYRARHRIVGNEVALKVLWPDHASDPQKVKRFLQEARAAAAVGSEHIVRVFDAGQTPEGVAFLALELLDGRDLDDELRARRTLPVDEAVAIVLEILDGLAAAHAQGIIHRDLKPGNVFLARAARGRAVKILDFGISKILGQKTMTAAGSILGTPQYMAPEQLAGDGRIDPRADLYAVGTILYELITGRVPFEGSGYEVLVERVQGKKPTDLRSLAPHVPPALGDVVMRALALDPDARWPDAKSMQDALRASVGDRALRIASAPTMPAVPKPAPSLAPSRSSTPVAEPVPARGAALALGALAVLLASGLGVFAVLGYRVATREDPAPPRPPATNAIPVPLPEAAPAVPEVAVPVPVPVPGAPEDPAAVEEAATRWEVLTYAGTGSRRAVEAMLERAVAETASCRGARPLRVVVTVLISGAAVRLAYHDPTRRSDDRLAADCVGEVIRRHGSVPFGATESASVTVSVELPAR